MERRTIIALGLSITILLLWSRYISKFYPIENKGVIEKIPRIISPKTPQIKEKIEKFSTEKFNLEIFSPPGAIKEIYLKDYGYKFSLENGFSLREQNKDLIFESIFREGKIISFYKDEEKEITRMISFPKEKNFIELELKTKNLLERDLNLNLDLLFLSLDLKIKPEESRLWEIDIFKSDQILRQSPLKIKKELVYKEDLQIIGIRDRYFCILLEPKELIGSVGIRRPEEKKIDLVLPLKIFLSPDSEDSRNFLLYLCPQDEKILKAIDPRFPEVIYFGLFNPISKFLLGFLKIFYQISRNWGLAIILLTFFIFLFFYPLTLKQLRSTKQIQALQPELENLRRLYKDNHQKLNKEIMELYRKNKVNPFGGCLPLFFQIPIFFSLYQGLMRSFDLRGANFLWIKDLSQPDAFPILGRNINLLPILMILMMFIQQRLSSFGLNREQKEQQRIMNIFFPLLFGFIFYNLPSGLVLYWFTHTLLTVLFQFRVLKSSKI